MMFLTSVKNAILTTVAGKKLRTITAVLFGPNDVKNAPECGPAGYDGSPITGLTAIFAKTTRRGDTVFLGYIPTNQLAQPGEARIYSTDSNGTEKAKIWIHGDGTVELGGTSGAVNPNNATQYQALELAITNYLTLLNTAINTGIVGAGGAYVPPPAINLTPAKLTKILVE